MRTIRPEEFTLDQQQVVADLIDPRRLIALRPIRILGPLVLYWTFGKTVHVFRRHAVATPRVRWIWRASLLIDNQGDEPR